MSLKHDSNITPLPCSTTDTRKSAVRNDALHHVDNTTVHYMKETQHEILHTQATIYYKPIINNKSTIKMTTQRFKNEVGSEIYHLQWFMG